MNRLLPLLLLALGACQNAGTVSSATPAAGTSTTSTTSTAVQALSQVSSSATTASQIGSVVGQPALAAGANAIAQAAGALADGLAGTPAATPAATPAVVADPSARFETQDVYTSLGDPQGMRALVPYLMHPDTWMLIKCEMTSATDKHYVFQKISTGTGRVMPEVDIFKGRK